MRLTVFPDATSAPARARVVEFASPPALFDWLEGVPSTECADEDAKRGSPCFALAHWRDDAGSRKWVEIAHDAATEVLVYDLDSMDAAGVAAALERCRGLDVLLYSTWKHTTEAPRLRLLVALDSPLSLTDKSTYKRVYRAGAARLGLEHDTSTCSPSNLFFLPQHRPANGPGPRVRMRGAPLPLGELLEVAEVARVAHDGAQDVEGVGARPDKGELKALAQRLRKRQAPNSRKGGLALAAVVRGEAYAEHGHVYDVTQQLAFVLAFDAPDIDEPWFRSGYLEPCWRVMWPGESLDKIETDWANAWRSARERRAEFVAAKAADRAAVTTPTPAEASAEARERAAAHRGALICLHGSAYYVFDPATGTYAAPVKAAGVAARARDLLGGIPGVQVTEPRDNGRPCAKSPTQLLQDYGCAVDHVHYYARLGDGPAFDTDSRSIKIQAYRWNHFEPRFSEICDDLWRTMAGERYALLEAWLTKFRRLERPLPALVLVGPKGVWKSKTAQTLSRFWNEPDAPTPCRAQQVMGRFSGPLQTNPVVWSDEALAVDERGRPMPERYRESISETVHNVERKGIDPVALHTALRHVISVNDLDLVFTREVHGDGVAATLDRYLVIEIDGAAMEAFEARWEDTPAIEALRDGQPMLEHVRWLEEHRAVPDSGRFGVETHTDRDVLLRAQFANDELGLILQVATDALLDESRRSVHEAARCPLRLVDGRLLFSPRVLVDLWPDARATRGYRGSTPTVGRVARTLAAAGFRNEGAGGPDGFPFDGGHWADWLRLGELYDMAVVDAALRKVLAQ